MTTDFVLGLAQKTLQTMLVTSLPVLLVSLIVGVVISLFQAVTQIQEQTLAFVPKIVVTFLALLLFGARMVNQLMSFTNEIFQNFPLWIR